MQIINKSQLKYLQTLITNSGHKRNHTILIGEKIILSWLQYKDACNNRFKPILLLKLVDSTAIPIIESITLNRISIISNTMMKILTNTNSPPNYALIIKIEQTTNKQLSKRVIIPYNIQDPGNLGTIIRTATAFGFKEIILGPLCADPFHPKTIRGSMGSTFAIPIQYHTNQITLDDGCWLALDSSKTSHTLDKITIKEPLRILIGNEGHGWNGIKLPEQIKRVAINTIKVDSLNAAVATGIICFEIARRIGLG